MYRHGTQLNIATHDLESSYGLMKGECVQVEKDYGDGTIRIYNSRLSLHIDVDEDDLYDFR